MSCAEEVGGCVRFFLSLLLTVFATPSYANSTTTAKQETLKKNVTSVLLQVTDAEFTQANCEIRLNQIHKTLQTIRWDLYSNAELRQDSLSIIEALWAARSRLHANLDKVNSSCALRMREVFHLMRDTEDYLGEFAYDVPAYNPTKINFQEQPIPILDVKAYPRYFVSSRVSAENFKFKSGDLMVARGISFLSAIISQVSNNHSQFSHVVFMNVDGKTKKTNTIESYIGVGVTRYELEYALKNENARLLVLRPKNLEWGAKAADLLNTRVTEGNGRGGPIAYDYGMDFVDHSTMSCAEIATASYRWASHGKLVLPTYPAQITMKNDAFLKQLSLKRGPIFTPGDLEIDPQFEMILDWRDPRLIRDSRYKDAILSEMMRWIGDLSYQFHETTKSVVAKYLIFPSRKTPVWGLVRQATGAPNLDKEIPKPILGLMTVLAQIGDALLEKVENEDKNHIAAKGRPMTNEQLRVYLESVRVQDLKEFENRRPSLIHYALRADSMKKKSRSKAASKSL